MLFFLFFLIFFGKSTCVVNTVENSKRIIDNTTIQISLKDYNISSRDGDSLEEFYILPPNSKSEIVLSNIPPEAHFVVLQVHSYLLDVILSYSRYPVRDDSVTGTNVGLIQMHNKTVLSFFLTFNSSVDDAEVMLSVQAYPVDAPIPGGCNMEFQVEISPFLHTTYNDFVTEINFAPSAPPASVLEKEKKALNECNIKPSPVEHEVYHRYFPERDFSKETYFGMLKSLMTRGRILQNGKLSPGKIMSSPVKRIFATYPGTGNAFVVITKFENYSAVYVPSFSYGCSDLKENDTCLVLTTTFSKILCAVVLFQGLFACFFGHFFFRIEMFLFGFMATGIVVYVLVSILFTMEFALTAAVTVGFFSAGLVLVAWTVFGLPIISVTLATLIFGFLLASVLYYPIIDFVDLFVLDINFWGIFIGIVITCPVLMIYLAEKANIFSCAFVGSYISILSIDHYIGSNLRYIIINTIRRAVDDKFKFAIIGPPFQIKDILLCVMWFCLMLSGIKMQKSLTRNKPPYPPPVNPLKNLFKKWKSPSPLNEPNERTPFFPNVPPNILPVHPTYTDYDGN